VSLAVQGQPLLDLIAPEKKLTFEGKLHFAGDDVNIHAALAPLMQDDLEIALSVSGPGLTLYETEGGALGLADPYRIEGQIGVADDAVNIEDIRASVGSSRFTGSLAWGKADAREQISGRLQSETMDLSDFLVTLPGNAEQAEAASAEERGISESNEESVLVDELDASLEQLDQAMENFDIDFSVQAAEVRSNGISLGGAELGVALEDDRFSVSLDKLNSDDGELSFEFSTRNLNNERLVTLRTQIERLDYAALSRSLAAMDSQGWVYADIEMESRAP
ncbi:unnamed protein product, partial [Discosporangium mesarthrocarpum]